MQERTMELLRKSSHIAGGNATYVEDLYEQYLVDPNAVPEQWRDYFDKLPLVETEITQIQDVPHSTIRERFAQQTARAHRRNGCTRLAGDRIRA